MFIYLLRLSAVFAAAIEVNVHGEFALSNYTGATAKALGVTGSLTLSGGAGAVTLALPNGALRRSK